MNDQDGIVVTGMGALGGGAMGTAELFAATLAGKSPGAWLDLPGLERPVAAARAPDPDLSRHEFRLVRRLDRAAQLGLAAAAQAIAMADLADGAGVGVIIGTSRGPIGRQMEIARDMERGSVSPHSSAEGTPGSMSGAIIQAFGFDGPAATISATCASGATAICYGALHLVSGEADAMIVGGAEAPLIASLIAQLQAARVTGWDDDPAATCKPFDVDRNGLMVGEGAAVLVLERTSSAARRGAIPLAKLAGWASGSDNGGRTGVSPDGAGLVKVMHRALQRAQLDPTDIGYVNAHGTATRLNDPVEALALNAFFGDGRVPPVSSTKPITGHCLGASPALEAVIAVEGMRAGKLPPTANHTDRDPACQIDVVAGEPRASRPRAVLSTSLGFWGTQAALIFEPA